MNHTGNKIWSDAPVVIDAANVAGDDHIPGCGKFCWDRVDAIREAWKQQMDPEATFEVVMDAGPGRQLGESCKQRYRRERNSGQVNEVDFADPEILLIAERADAAVITRDFYKDARRAHPWLEGNQSQFFEWKVEHGHILITPRDMGSPSEFDKTLAEERAELKGRGVDISLPEVELALRTAYRCDNKSCWLNMYDPGHYTGTPDLQIPGEPRCTACQQPLTVLGVAPRLVQIKFAETKGTKLERRTFAPDMSLVIGRETSDELFSTVLGEELGLISRRHARLDWDGSQLTLTDLGSKNGTTVRRWAGKRHGYKPAEPVKGHVFLHPRDEACLASVLLITRSARAFTLTPDALKGGLVGANPPTIAQDGVRR
jgi:hypothetical protein